MRSQVAHTVRRQKKDSTSAAPLLTMRCAGVNIAKSEKAPRISACREIILTYARERDICGIAIFQTSACNSYSRERKKNIRGTMDCEDGRGKPPGGLLRKGKKSFLRKLIFCEANSNLQPEMQKVSSRERRLADAIVHPDARIFAAGTDFSESDFPGG